MSGPTMRAVPTTAAGVDAWLSEPGDWARVGDYAIHRRADDYELIHVASGRSERGCAATVAGWLCAIGVRLVRNPGRSGSGRAELDGEA